MQDIQAIIGLGNPGNKFYNNRHNIGFQILDALAEKYNASWSEKANLEYAQITIDNDPILLIKPMTFMNESGKVIPFLKKQGINPKHILVVHDELEKPFGKISYRFGGSARGHNGLRSIIDYIGKDFGRLRFGIGRPEDKKDVARYVLEDFSESQSEIDRLIQEAIEKIETLIKGEQL